MLGYHICVNPGQISEFLLSKCLCSLLAHCLIMVIFRKSHESNVLGKSAHLSICFSILLLKQFLFYYTLTQLSYSVDEGMEQNGILHFHYDFSQFLQQLRKEKKSYTVLRTGSLSLSLIDVLGWIIFVAGLPWSLQDISQHPPIRFLGQLPPSQENKKNVSRYCQISSCRDKNHPPLRTTGLKPVSFL